MTGVPFGSGVFEKVIQTPRWTWRDWLLHPWGTYSDNRAWERSQNTYSVGVTLIRDGASSALSSKGVRIRVTMPPESK